MRTERIDGAGLETQYRWYQGWDTSHIEDMVARQEADKRLRDETLRNAEKGVLRVLSECGASPSTAASPSSSARA